MIGLKMQGLDAVLIDAYSQFCLRAASLMGAWVGEGSRGLPTRMERWSVLSSPHVHKTAWTQFERRTYNRQLSIGGLHSSLVSKYIWYIQRHAPPDVSLHADIHETV